METVAKKRVVIFGGGNGSAMTLRALKRHLHSFDISAVISMSDSGGSSGRLRKEFHTLPPGDILRAILASSPHSYKEALKPVFNTVRFQGANALEGHNLGNLFLVLAEQYAGSFMAGVQALSQAVDAQATIYPATLSPSDLAVETTDGRTIVGEHEIDRPAPPRSRIMKAWLEPAVPAYAPAIDAITSADIIILGPGSLYCSIIASLLPQGIREAIAASSAHLIYIAGDIYELEGEAGPEVLADFVHELEAYLPRKIDTVLVNGAELSALQEAYYEERKWGRLIIDTEKLQDYQIISDSFEKYKGGLDPEKLGNIMCSAFGLNKQS